MTTAGSDDISVRMQRAQEYLNSTLRFTSKNTLDDLKEYLKRLGVPADGMKIVHVAGTNGKGSVCSQIASCLREAGFRVGLFISPHLSDIRERMTIDGEMISEEKFLACFETVRKEAEAAAGDGGQAIRRMLPAGRFPPSGGCTSDGGRPWPPKRAGISGAGAG